MAVSVNIIVTVKIIFIVVVLILIIWMFKKEIKNFFKKENLKKLFKKIKEVDENE